MEKNNVSRKKAQKLTVSRKKAKILTVNRKSLYPIETLYKRWLGIFLSLKSPDEWAITKQARRDKSVFFFLFSICIHKYINKNDDFTHIELLSNVLALYVITYFNLSAYLRFVTLEYDIFFPRYFF